YSVITPHCVLSAFIRPRPSRSPLFPYTTLFRSRLGQIRPGGEPQTHLRRKEADPLHPARSGRHPAGSLRRGRKLHPGARARRRQDRKSTRLNSSHVSISYAVFCLKKKTTK